MARHHSGRSRRLRRPAEAAKAAPAPPRHRRSSCSGSQIWKKLPRPTKATSVVMPVCSRMKSRHRDAPVLVELQEGAVAMHEEGHVVRRLQERILQRDPLLVAVEQVEPADIQRRHVERADRVEFRIAALLHHRAEMRRHGNPPLRVDPVHRTRQKPVHHSHTAAFAAVPHLVMLRPRLRQRGPCRKVCSAPRAKRESRPRSRRGCRFGERFTRTGTKS